MIGRRPFLIGCGSTAVGPALAHLGLPVIGPLGVPSAAADAQRSTALADVAGAQHVTLRIDGWDTPDDAGRTVPGEAWVHINSSWRAAWR